MFLQNDEKGSIELTSRQIVKNGAIWMVPYEWRRMNGCVLFSAMGELGGHKRIRCGVVRSSCYQTCT